MPQPMRTQCTALSAEYLENLAECLYTPLSDDRGLGESVQAEVDSRYPG